MSIQKNEGGFVLIITLLIILFVLLFCTVLVRISIRETKLAVYQMLSERAFYYADSGINKAISLVRHKNITYPYNIIGVDLNNGKYNLQIEQNSNRIYTANSKGYLKNNISRRIKSKFYIRHARVFDYTIASNSSLNIGSNALVSSFPNSGNGNIYANGNLSIGGSCIIDGNTDATGIISTTGNGCIEGEQNSGCQSITFPQIDSNTYQQQAQSGNIYIGDKTYNNGFNNILSDTYIDGNLYVNNSTELQLDGVLYVAGSIIVSGGASICGGFPIIAEGNIKFTGNTNNEAPLVLSVYGDINVTGDSSQRGFIYAQNGTASVSGNGDVYGAVIGQNISLSGNGRVYRLDNYNFELPFDETSRVDILYWKEQ